MKIGRNEPCHCGSGTKYKKCCLCKDQDNLQNKPIQRISGSINFGSFPPEIEGFDEMPDLKAHIKRALINEFLNPSCEPEEFMEREMRAYNTKIDEVNSRLPKPYGVILRELNQLISEEKYERAVKLADSLLEAYPESYEANECRQNALFSLGKHPLQHFYSEILNASSTAEKQKLSEKFWNEIMKNNQSIHDKIFRMAEKHYRESESWQGKYAALDLVKAMKFADLTKEAVALQENLLLDALRDDDGRVRNNAFYCSAYKMGISIPFKFFFRLFDAALTESNPAKRHSICRTILKMICPATDEAMRATGKNREYQHAIDFSLKVTGDDPAYYKASTKDKMMWGLGGRRQSPLS